MEGMKDWNEVTLKESVEHLRQEFMFSSSGTAKCVHNLIEYYDRCMNALEEFTICKCASPQDKFDGTGECVHCNNPVSKLFKDIINHPETKNIFNDTTPKKH